MTGVVRTLLVVAAMASAGLTPAWAHKGSDAYLDVQQTSLAASASASGASAGADDASSRGFRFTLSVAIKDLDQILPLDANADGKVTWGEVRTATPAVQQLLNEVANIEPPAMCRLAWQADGVEQRGDGAYMRMVAQAMCPLTQALAFKYTLFRDQDATHRLLVAGRIGGRDLLTTTSPQQPAPLLLSMGETNSGGKSTMTNGTASTNAQPSGRWTSLRDYFLLGMHHLLEGYDHLAFLLALVLPLQLNLRSVPRLPTGLNLPPDLPGHRSLVAMPGVPSRRHVWLALLRTITAFTLGHSITLMLATFGWTQASPAWVEPVIAASIAVTALLNLRPANWLRTDVLALVFGLVHGFGFAGLLQEAAAPTGLLPWALAGFNIGVEAGQLIAVSGWVLLSQLVVARSWYASVVVRGGSIALVGLATWWFWQRVS